MSDETGTGPASILPDPAPAGAYPVAAVATAIRQRWWNSPGTWIGFAASIAFLTLTLLMFIGLYLARQKTGELAHRLNVMEAQLVTANGLDVRVTALERQTRVQPAPEQPDSQKHTADASQTAEVAMLSRQVQDLQLSSGNRDAMAQTLAGLQQTVASLQANLQSLVQDTAATKGKIAELDTTLNQKKAENARQFAILLGLNQLREVASTSQSFASQLAFVRTLAADDPDVLKQLEPLSANAADGVPTLNELRAEFADKASEIVRSNVVGDGKSSFRQALYRLGSVVSVRKIGNVTTHNLTETAVAQAESKLEEDDLAGAVKALEDLKGLPQDVATGWIDSASKRVAVDEALNGLSELSIRRLEGFQTVSGARP